MDSLASSESINFKFWLINLTVLLQQEQESLCTLFEVLIRSMNLPKRQKESR